MKSLSSLKKSAFVGISSLALALGLMAAPALANGGDHRGGRGEHREHRGDRHEGDRERHEGRRFWDRDGDRDWDWGGADRD